MIPKPGVVIDGYKLLSFIGSGSSGTVWQAENVISKELLALKIFPAQGSLAEREIQALRLYRELTHPALITIRHAGKIDGAFFYTMDWCESSLAQRKVTPEELFVIAGRLAEALAVLHEHGLLHRDIKPENIFFRNGQAVLGDIGLVTRRENASFAGSPGFLAPGLLSGQTAPDAYTDCYALAKSIYCALSGKPPEKFPLYDGPLNEAASQLMRCVLAVCEDDPKIHTAAEFLVFLNGAEHGAGKKSGLRRKLPVAAVCIVISAAVFFVFFAARLKEQNTPSVKLPQQRPPAADAGPRKTEQQRQRFRPSVGTGGRDEIAVRRGWNERNKVELSRGASGLRKCRLEFETAWNEWRIEMLQRPSENFNDEQKILFKLWRTVEKLLETGAEAENPFGYEELAGLLRIEDPESAELFRKADAAWNVQKQKAIKDLFRSVKKNKTDPETVLLKMAQRDPAVRFFAVEQRQLLEKYKEVRFSGLARAKEEALDAVSRYLKCRKTFLSSLRPPRQ